MKRSEINKIINETIDYMKGRDFPLPPFAYWGKKDWENADNKYQEIVDNMLGWDITDFGTGDFEHYGLTVFTFRNGNFHNKEKYPKPYAEKLLLVNDGQILPYHYHWSKMEDIINRGGGDLELTLYNATPADFNDVEGGRSGKPGTFDSTPVTVHIDGCEQTFPAGTTITLKPGQSITLTQGQYHTWRGVPGTGKVMLFEVSMTNDDHLDNRFKTAAGRIPEVEEDEEIEHLMFADYDKVRK
jgi:D-lyxose ketol-isomerase